MNAVGNGGNMINESIWNQHTIPTKVKVEILNPNYARQEGGKLIFSKDEKAIGEYNPNDPDGGRSIYGAATVTFEDDEAEILFQYRAKYWTGLEAIILLKKEGEKYAFSPSFDEELPKWAVQEED
jgi:hypothetical protein